MKEVRKKRQKSKASIIRSVPVEKRSKPRKKKTRTPCSFLQDTMKNCTIMAIDPSISHLGWSVSEVSSGDYSTERRWIARGSIFTSPSKRTRTSTISSIYDEPDGTSPLKEVWKVPEGYNRMVYEVIKKLESIQRKFSVDTLVIEDYVLLEHKTTGAFSVPAFIGALKHHWYLNHSKETIMIPAPDWKEPICGYAYASKSDICDAVKRSIGNEWFSNVGSMYSTLKTKKERNPQDCIDAIGIDLYIFKCIKNMVKYGDNLMEEILKDEQSETKENTDLW